MGRLVHANNAERKVSIFCYECGKPAEIWQDNWLTKHEYDSTGRRVLTQLPDGSQIDYRYSETGLLTEICWQQQQLLSRHFDKSNREKHRNYGNSVSLAQTFNSKGLLVEQNWQQTDGLQQRVYQYDQADQLVGIKDNQLGDTRYQFDELKQLIQCTQSNNDVPFTPDSFGNPCGEDIQIEADRLLKWQESQFSYDAYGNQSRVYRQTGHEQRQFNGLNQLTSVKVGGKYTQYQYDALGRRSAKITGQQCTDYLWDGEQLIGEHCNGEFTWYIYEPDSFRPVALIKQGLVYYYHLDHLGTPLQLTDSQGYTAWRAEYSAYGKASQYVASVNNPLRFQGQYHDEETGLHYNRFRYYDPETGRFIHQDPIGLLGGINPYQYAPNLVQWVDPLGLSCKEDKVSSFSALNKRVAINEFGTMDPIKGWASKGFVKTMISDATFGIVYGETSSIPFLRADPIDRADMEAYEEVAGLERYASIFIPTGAANFTKGACSEGIQLAKSSNMVRDLADSVDEVVPNSTTALDFVSTWTGKQRFDATNLTEEQVKIATTKAIRRKLGLKTNSDGQLVTEAAQTEALLSTLAIWRRNHYAADVDFQVLDTKLQGTIIPSSVSNRVRQLNVKDLSVNQRLYGQSQYISSVTGAPYEYRIPDFYHTGTKTIFDIKPEGTALSGPQYNDFKSFADTDDVRWIFYDNKF
ncbi:Rhs family protein [Photobacterium marinum]|uniref:Rhs family protein n=1 Tax=Photobacterium marinum TaxID=1056511 RepID=L8J6U2_9GAMM|nr:RHS repeat-associated core domain-containing protein [Photobacterium marinum]ELR64580.1 Rhs family protein [Photobacterium marinum]